MIIYNETIDQFIDDCNNDIVAKLRFILKQKRGININANSKEAESWNTLKKIAQLLKQLNPKDKQYVLLEYVIRDSFKRIDLMLAGRDSKNNKNLAIIELKGWSKIDLYENTNLLNPHVSYGLQNHPSYEAYDYYYILTNMYDEINQFQLFCYSYLPNYEYKNINVLKDRRFDQIIKLADSYCKNDNIDFINILNNLFNHCIDKQEVSILDNLEYKPTKTFKEYMQEECQNIRLLGTQNVAYNKFISEIQNQTNKTLYLISGSAGSRKTIVAFKIMTYLRSLGDKSFLILPGPEFREAIKKIYGKTIAASFIRGADSYLEADNVIIDEAHKATGRDDARIFYNRILKNISKSMICLIDDNQVINKKGITKNELIEIALKNNWKIVQLNLLEQFRNGGDVSYVDWLKKMIFNQDNNQEFFVNDFFDFRILDGIEFNQLYDQMYDQYNVRLVSFWTQTWDLNSLEPTVVIANKKYTWNPNWQWLSKYKQNGNEITKQLDKLCNHLNFNQDKKGKQFIGYFNTVQGYEFDYIFVHVPKMFYLNENNEIDVDINQLYMREMKSQIWATNKIKDKQEKIKKENLNKYYFLNRLFVNLTRGTKGTIVYFEDKKLEKYFKDKLILNKKY